MAIAFDSLRRAVRVENEERRGDASRNILQIVAEPPEFGS
jgi:hypothetical protein